MKKLVSAAVLVFSLSSVSAFASTFKGTVSDAMCGAKHVNATKADQECAQKCVKGGEAAVFVMGDKVYKIDNQDAVKDQVGHKVTLTGTKNGDTIHVDKVSM